MPFHFKLNCVQILESGDQRRYRNHILCLTESVEKSGPMLLVETLVQNYQWATHGTRSTFRDLSCKAQKR
jgi:hypothetical protein